MEEIGQVASVSGFSNRKLVVRYIHGGMLYNDGGSQIIGYTARQNGGVSITC